jgi:hypothetical protein
VIVPLEEVVAEPPSAPEPPEPPSVTEGEIILVATPIPIPPIPPSPPRD